MKKSALIFILAGLLASGLTAQGQDQESDEVLRLHIGDPQLRDKTLEVRPDVIYSAQTGRSLDFAQMIQELAEVRLIYVGETHNSLPMHRIQAQIIRALYERNPSLTVGMEMFNPIHQEHLNKWAAGLLTPEEFVHEARWYETWNFHFGFYADVFSAAKSLRIPLYGLNAPREIISKIRMQGWDSLSDEEKALVPEPDVSHTDHRAYIRAVFENMEMPHAMEGPGLDMVFEGLYRAQSAWDEVMAENVLNSLAYTRNSMVVLAGSGHLLYNLGINRRANEKNGWPFKTVISVVVPKGGGSIEVSRTLGDYIWGLPAEERPAYPSFGLSLKKFEGLDNPVVERKPFDGVALDAGFEKGDVILSIDVHQFKDINTLRTYLAHFTWGDKVEFRVLREGQVKTIEVVLEHKEEQ